MNRRSFLAAAVAALTGATVAKSALLPLTLSDTPIELAKQAGIPVPPVAVVTRSTYGIHPALLADSPLDIHSMVYEKFAREVARKLDDDMWGSVIDKKGFAEQVVSLNSRFGAFPARKLSR